MGLIKFTKVPQLMILYPFYRQLVPVITTCKIFLLILKQFTTNEYTVKDSVSFLEEILHQDPTLFMTHLSLLIFSYCLQIYPWMKRLIFVLIWFSIKRRKTCLSGISSNYLPFLLSHIVFFLMMFIINKLMT